MGLNEDKTESQLPELHLDLEHLLGLWVSHGKKRELCPRKNLTSQNSSQLKETLKTLKILTAENDTDNAWRAFYRFQSFVTFLCGFCRQSLQIR